MHLEILFFPPLLPRRDARRVARSGPVLLRHCEPVFFEPLLSVSYSELFSSEKKESGYPRLCTGSPDNFLGRKFPRTTEKSVSYSEFSSHLSFYRSSHLLLSFLPCRKYLYISPTTRTKEATRERKKNSPALNTSKEKIF